MQNRPRAALDRRTLLATIALGSSGFAGCLGFDSDDPATSSNATTATAKPAATTASESPEPTTTEGSTTETTAQPTTAETTTEATTEVTDIEDGRRTTHRRDDEYAGSRHRRAVRSRAAGRWVRPLLSSRAN